MSLISNISNAHFGLLWRPKSASLANMTAGIFFFCSGFNPMHGPEVPFPSCAMHAVLLVSLLTLYAFSCMAKVTP
jgi:hypothetical protein